MLQSRKVAISVPDEVKPDFSIYLIFQPYYDPGIYSASKRNEYQDRSARKVHNLTPICELIV
jgi:hypothetical protein